MSANIHAHTAETPAAVPPCGLYIDTSYFRHLFRVGLAMTDSSISQVELEHLARQHAVAVVEAGDVDGRGAELHKVPTSPRF